MLNHSGRPNLSVKIKCLVVLNIYGINPNKFIIMITKNRGATIEVRPFSLFMYVRLS